MDFLRRAVQLLSLLFPPGDPAGTEDGTVGAARWHRSGQRLVLSSTVPCGSISTVASNASKPTAVQSDRQGRVFRCGTGGRHRTFVAADLLKDFFPDDCAKLRSTPHQPNMRTSPLVTTEPRPNFPADIVMPVGYERSATSEPSCCTAGATPVRCRRVRSVMSVHFNHAAAGENERRRHQARGRRGGDPCLGPAPEPSTVHLFRYDNGLTIAKPGHYKTLDSVRIGNAQGHCPCRRLLSQAGVEAAVFSGEEAA